MSTPMRSRIQLPKIMRIRILNPATQIEEMTKRGKDVTIALVMRRGVERGPTETTANTKRGQPPVLLQYIPSKIRFRTS